MRSKAIGATLIVAGTTIGAGMLALPIEARNVGFYPSIILMVLMWLWMYRSAMLMVNLFLKNPKYETLPDLSGAILGNAGYVISVASLLMLFYTLLAAYTAGGTMLLNLFIPSYGSFFALPLAVSVFICFRAADLLNRFLFALKVIIFGAIFVMLTPMIDLSHLNVSHWNSDYTSIIPIFFTAFGFHGSISVVIEYIGRDRDQLKKVIFYGSVIPLFVYVIWLAIGFGITKVPHSTLDAFVLGLSGCVPHFKIFINLFSLLAIATSYIGVFMALFDLLNHETFVRQKINQLMVNFFNAYFGMNTSSRATEGFFKSRGWTFLMALIPSFLLGLLFPNGFIFGLSYAAAFLSIFAIILPCLMALKQKRKDMFFVLLSLLLGSIIIFIH